MEIMTVKDVSYSKECNSIILICVDKKGNEIEAPTSPTLAPKVGDNVWVFKNEELHYKGYNTVALLIA